MNAPRITKAIKLLYEIEVQQVRPDWSRETLRKQEGYFFLQDVCRTLSLPFVTVKKAVTDLPLVNDTFPTETGVMLVLNKYWIVYMPQFRFYAAGLTPELRSAQPHWDTRTFLQEPGVFKYKEVYRYYPFARNKFMQLSRKSSDPRAEMGLWKDPFRRCYLVENPAFAQFFKNRHSMVASDQSSTIRGSKG